MPSSIALKTLNDQATELIRERIVDGEFAPASRVLEVELAEEMGISRATLRAALQQLVHEGLVVQSRFRSTYVASLTSRDAYEVYTLRNTLEEAAVREVTARVDHEVRDALGAAMAVMRTALRQRDRTSVVRADYAFHTCLVNLSHHGRLQGAYKQMDAQIRLFLRLTATLDYDLPQIVRIHQEMTDAILSGEGEQAGLLARDHNTADGKRMVDQLRRQEDEE